MRHQFSTIKIIWSIFIIILTVAFNGLVLAQMQPNTDTTKFTFKKYTIKKYQSTSQTWHLEVYQQFQKVFGLEADKAGHLQFVAINGQTTHELTQDGQPNLILQKYLATPQEEVTWHILSLAPDNFEEITNITTQFGSPWLADFEQDGKYEIVLKDYVFANWNSDFLNSPYQLVYLTLENRKYLPSQKLMQQDPPQDLEDRAARIHQVQEAFYQKNKNTYPYEVNVLGGEVSQRWSFIPSDLWATLLALYYTNQGDSAKSFLDKAWYAPLEGKEEFWKDFHAQLAKSPYWQQIQQWSGTASLGSE